MGTVRIVTDSSAQFLDRSISRRHNVTVLPVTICFGKNAFQEGVDFDAEDFFQFILTENMPQPEIKAPSVETFVETYLRYSREADGIVSIHMAHGLSDTYKNAQAAKNELQGHSEIVVIDSLSVSVGLGFLVQMAAQTAQRGESLENVVRAVRGATPRVYSVFYVETLDYLYRGNLIGEAQAILGKMLGIKPFLTIEDGHLITMEKVRTRAQAIDKLMEFVSEFSDVEQLVILQNTSHTTEQTRMLQDRLALEFDGRDFPVMMYGPTLGTHLGPDGVGIVVYEALDED